jgi:hypothetical protein
MNLPASRNHPCPPATTVVFHRRPPPPPHRCHPERSLAVQAKRSRRTCVSTNQPKPYSEPPGAPYFVLTKYGDLQLHRSRKPHRCPPEPPPSSSHPCHPERSLALQAKRSRRTCVSTNQPKPYSEPPGAPYFVLTKCGAPSAKSQPPRKSAQAAAHICRIDTSAQAGKRMWICRWPAESALKICF